MPPAFIGRHCTFAVLLLGGEEGAVLDEVQGFFAHDVVEGHEGVIGVKHKVFGNSVDMGLRHRYPAIIFAGNEER